MGELNVAGNSNYIRQYILNIWEHFTDENIAVWLMAIFCYLSMFFFIWTLMFGFALAKIVGTTATTITAGESIPITAGALIASLAITFSVCSLVPLTILMPKVWKKVREKKQRNLGNL